MFDDVQKAALRSGPKPGMVFHEMYTFWVVITEVGADGGIEALSYSGHPRNPCVHEDNGKFQFSRIEAHRFLDMEAFLAKFYYTVYDDVFPGHLQTVTALYLYQEALFKTLGIKEGADINTTFRRMREAVASGQFTPGAGKVEVERC